MPRNPPTQREPEPSANCHRGIRRRVDARSATPLPRCAPALTGRMKRSCVCCGRMKQLSDQHPTRSVACTAGKKYHAALPNSRAVAKVGGDGFAGDEAIRSARDPARTVAGRHRETLSPTIQLTPIRFGQEPCTSPTFMLLRRCYFVMCRRTAFSSMTIFQSLSNRWKFKVSVFGGAEAISVSTSKIISSADGECWERIL